MSEDFVLESELLDAEMKLRWRRESLAGSEMPDEERDRQFLSAVLDLVRDYDQASLRLRPVLQYLCDVYETAPGYGAAPLSEKGEVRIGSARASLLASLDPELATARRFEELASARAKLHSARILLEPRSDFLAWVKHYEAIAAGLSEGDVKTALRFDIPMVLPVPDGEYEIRIDDKLAQLKVAYRVPGSSRFGTVIDGPVVQTSGLTGHPLQWLEFPMSEHINKVELFAAKRMSIGFTSVVVLLPGYVKPYVVQKQINLPELKFPFDEYVPKTFTMSVREQMRDLGHIQSSDAKDTAVRLLNRLIDQIRLSGERFELERLLPGDIEQFALVVLVGGQAFISSPLISHGNPQAIVGRAFAHDWQDDLRRALLSEVKVPIERFLILDARRFLYQRELRLAVLNVNAALEAFVNRHFSERLEGLAPETEIRSFLDGSSIFENCRGQLIEMAKQGDKAALNAAELLPTPVVQNKWKPPVNQMVSEMHRHLPFGLSKTKLSKLINRIRRSRNEVAHGQFEDADLKLKDVEDSLNALEEFISRAESTLAENHVMRNV
jgi:hypothetical protein